jgi:hypothetical protein
MLLSLFYYQFLFKKGIQLGCVMNTCCSLVNLRADFMISWKRAMFSLLL